MIRSFSPSFSIFKTNGNKLDYQYKTTVSVRFICAPLVRSRYHWVVSTEPPHKAQRCPISSCRPYHSSSHTTQLYSTNLCLSSFRLFRFYLQTLSSVSFSFHLQTATSRSACISCAPGNFAGCSSKSEHRPAVRSGSSHSSATGRTWLLIFNRSPPSSVQLYFSCLRNPCCSSDGLARRLPTFVLLPVFSLSPIGFRSCTFSLKSSAQFRFSLTLCLLLSVKVLRA